MRTIFSICICLSFILSLCWYYGPKYSYVENKVYVYSYNDTIIRLKDRYGSYYKIPFDSTIYKKYKNDNRTSFIIRKYDNGNIYVVN